MVKEKTVVTPHHIASIHIEGMWGKYNVDWELDPKVNILGGINGSGKTTILNVLAELIQGKINRQKNTFREAQIRFDDFELDYPHSFKGGQSKYLIPNFTQISTFDIPIKDRRKISKYNTQLDVELKNVIDGNSSDFNFVKLHSKAQSKVIQLFEADKKEEAKQEKNRINYFFDIVDDFFQKTNKSIQFTENKNIIFQNGSSQLKTNQLSSGEKQLLIILFQVFLQEQKPYILLLDEPEISLHLSWQFKLIETIRAINPNCQLIIATHSPGIFGEGWEDKFINIETLMSA